MDKQDRTDGLRRVVDEIQQGQLHAAHQGWSSALLLICGCGADHFVHHLDRWDSVRTGIKAG